MKDFGQTMKGRTFPWSQDRDRWLVGLAIGVSVLILIVLVVVMVRAGGEQEADPLAQDSRVDDNNEPEFGQQDPIVADDPDDPAQEMDEDPFGVGEDDQGPPPVTFTSETSGYTEMFDVHDGLLLLRVVHNGTGPFEVQLVPEGGQGIPVLLGSGTYRAVRAAQMPDGPYRLEVQASGPWAVSVEQPVIGEGLEVPASVEGDGESVSDPLELESGDPLEVSVSTESGDPLYVRVLNSEGELLAETELADGHNIIEGLEPGIVIFDVRGDSLWQLHVRQ